MSNARRRPLGYPTSDDPKMQAWIRRVTDTINELPPVSAFSSDTPEGEVVAASGTWGINHKPGGPGVWVKTAGDGDTGWQDAGATALRDTVQAAIAAGEIARPSGHGGILVNDNTTAQTFSSGITTKVNFNINNQSVAMPSKNCTPQVGGNTVEVNAAGDYFCAASVAIRTATGGALDWRFHIAVDGVTSNIGFHRRLSGTNDLGSAGCQGILRLDAGDAISLTGTATGGATLVVEDGQLTVVRL